VRKQRAGRWVMRAAIRFEAPPRGVRERLGDAERIAELVGPIYCLGDWSVFWGCRYAI